MSRFGYMLVFLSTVLVLLCVSCTTMTALSTSTQGDIFPQTSMTATAQAVEQGVPPDIPSDWIPSNCSLNDQARGTTYRLPWAYFGAAPGIDGDPNLGAQVLLCPDGYHALYWDMRYDTQGKLVDPYHELSGTAAYGCWYEERRYLGFAVGAHDPYLGDEQVWAEQWGRDAPMFGKATISAGKLNIASLSLSCTAS